MTSEGEAVDPAATPAAPGPVALRHEGTVDVDVSLPLSLVCGQKRKVVATVTNDSDGWWLPSEPTELLLTQTWLRPDGEVLARDVGRAKVEEALAPGAQVALTVQLTAPEDAGSYEVELTLRRRHGAWLDRSGFTPLRLPVHVGAAEPPAASDSPGDVRQAETGLPYLGTVGWQAAAPLLLLGSTPRTLAATITNSSDGTWSASEPTQLLLTQVWTDARGETLARDVGRVALAHDLPPGGSAEVELTVQAPEAAGPLALEVTLRRRHGPWLASQGFVPLRTAVEVRSLDDHARARVRWLEAVPTVLLDEPLTVSVEVENTGTWTWADRGFGRVVVSHRWFDEDGRQLERTGRKTALPRPVRPGERATVAAQIKPPTRTGPLTLEVTLIHEGVTWFSSSRNADLETRVVEIRDPAKLTADELDAARQETRRRERETLRTGWDAWRDQYQVPPEELLLEAVRAQACWTDRPRFVVVVDGSHQDAAALSRTLTSLRGQVYEGSTGYVVNAPSGIRVEHPFVTGGESMTYDDLDEDTFCLRLHAGDELASHALLLVADEIRRVPGTQWVTWDSDEETEDGSREFPRLLTGFDPDLAVATDWLVRSGAVRASLLQAALPATRMATSPHIVSVRLALQPGVGGTRHLPFLLQTRSPDETGRELRLRTQAVTSAFAARGQEVRVVPSTSSDGVRISFVPEELPLVSVIVPTRDRLPLLRRCLEGLFARTDYPRLEVIVVDNDSAEPSALRYLERMRDEGLVRLLRHPGPFNWSDMNNRAVSEAAGDVLCFLNNDVVVQSDSWLRSLVGHALRPDVGVVGPVLRFGDNSIQHAGVVLHLPHGAFHALRGLPFGAEVPETWEFTRTISAVTGACLVTRRSTFEAAGGFDAQALPVGLNDVDFCLRVGELGLRSVMTPDVELFHLESQSRGGHPTEAVLEERARSRAHVRNTWYEQLVADPALSPNLAPLSSASVLRSPPGQLLRARLTRLARRDGWRRLAFVHIPKTAGSSLRERFQEEYGRGQVLAISPRLLLRCYEGDGRARREAVRRAADADVLYSHFGYGFAELLGLSCSYATVLRDPVERVASHFAHLQREAFSPLDEAGLAGMSLVDAVSSGVVPDNLMCRRILGERPESVTWDEIVAAGQVPGANFVGFSLPEYVWSKTEPVATPPRAEVTAAAAWTRLVDDFSLVALSHSLDEAMSAFGRAAGWWSAGTVGRRNVRPTPAVLSTRERALIQELNAADMELYERLSSQPGGLILNPDLLSDDARAEEAR